MVLAMSETADVVFAADFIPVILTISRTTLIVYTSNVFAVLGAVLVVFRTLTPDGSLPLPQLRAGIYSHLYQPEATG